MSAGGERGFIGIDAAAPLCLFADVLVCYAAFAIGASLQFGQGAGFLAAVLLSCRFVLGAKSASFAKTGGARLLCSLTVVSLLAFSLRSGMLELSMQNWRMPRYVGLPLAAIAGGIFLQIGYGLCAASPGFEASQRQWRRLALVLAAYALVLRVVYAGQIELLPEETYYWNYSRHLDIGYLDHPPMVAWMIRLGTDLFGANEFGVRVGALACGIVAATFLFRLTRHLFDEASALAALVLAQILPFFFFSGLLMTPDAPLTAAWAGSMYFLARALLGGRANAWPWVGIFMGIGLLSKYTIGLLGVGVLVFMVIDAPSRRWFRRWEPYAALLIALLVFAPVVVWNAQHDWASFAFQTSRRLAERPRFALPQLIGAAIVLITPTGAFAALLALCRPLPRPALASGRETAARSWCFIRVSLGVPLAVFVIFSLRHEIKLDWTGAAWVAALPALAYVFAGAPGGGSNAARWVRAAWVPTLLVALLFYSTGFYYLVLGLPDVGYPTHTELVPFGWRDLGRQIDTLADGLRGQFGDRFLVVGMDRYAIASEVAFYSRDQAAAVAATTAAHLFGDVGLMYEQWFPPAGQLGSTLLLVAWDRDALATEHLQRHVAALDPIREGTLTCNGRVVRHYFYRVAHDYRLAGAAGG